MRYPVIIGNWKLHGNKKNITLLLKKLHVLLKDHKLNINISIAPPILYIDLVKRVLTELDSPISLSAQNADLHNQGAFTGEISPEMLKDLGVSNVILGHSERRRYHKESNKFIAEKFSIIKNNGLIPILCIGESMDQKKSGQTIPICIHQINSIINTQGIEALNNSIIAYEPIWAIGTGVAASPDYVQNVHSSIRSYIKKKSSLIAENIIIQYGGSVNLDNAASYFIQPDIDGALIGGASLNPELFVSIIKAMTFA
ncbi:triosephosphate isomerase [Candidatus Photodesmus katoptron]|uniref:Triosephosphate isomerase n=1 Tax=Candidatus Photodesmus katoptron Akat1 TaxID=1236703 RepID=S3DZX7_9GAMM|nr:triose-phosphate isomerase [Candidatus Photodesmus katoptron]EPE37521.1 triose-phosphate isomerase [Candidatus Photodesmus katoptron Akat1]KEY90170.1 triosephosphate isomerase [Candidatus Photodesmus katoptron]